MKYIAIMLVIFVVGCTAWDEYDWESDFFKKRYTIIEVPIDPLEKLPQECSQCICNMDLCT